MTSPGGNRRSPGGGRAGRTGGPVSSPRRRGRTCRGTITRTAPSRTSRRAPAGAAGSWPGARDLGVRHSHQVTDLPAARAETIQHDRHEVECACGRTPVAGPPPEAAGAPGTVTLRLNFQAWCVFLLVMHHVPVERCADILGSMSGTRPSDGWVHALLARAATAVAAANKTIRALIILARVVCGDETPIRSGPGQDQEEVPAGRLHQPAHVLLPGRPGPALVQGLHLQRPARHRDRARPVRQLRPLHRRQPPAVHSAPAQGRRGRRPVLPGRHLARPDRRGPARSHPRRQPVPRPGPGRGPRGDDRGAPDAVPPRRHRRAVPGPPRPGYQDQAAASPAPAGMPAPPRSRRAAVPSDTAIPPTSNQAERDLRPSKTQQKISGRLRSDKTTRDRYAIRGYASTAAKHGIAVFTAIRDALTGNPWIPPIPATA